MVKIDKLGVFLFSLLIIVCYLAYYAVIDMKNQDLWIGQQEDNCREKGGYLETDYERGRGNHLKQVFCWNSTGDILIFKAAYQDK